MILVTRDPDKCPQCKMLKMKLSSRDAVEYETVDADSADGMALMAYHEVDTVPCLILDDDTAVLDVDKIFLILSMML